MSDEHKTVFISYRRDVASFIARAVFQDLRAHGYDVFMDVESIYSGAFDRIILGQIAARAHFVVILTPGTTERFQNPNDMMRCEIETAMEKQRNIVPLLVRDFDFKDAGPHLIGKLAELQRHNGLRVPHDYFEEAMTRLRDRYLKEPVYGDIEETPEADRAAVEEKIAEVVAQPEVTPIDLTAEQWLDRGLDAIIRGDPDDAISCWSEAIRLKPDYARAYSNRGGALSDLRRYSEAISDLNKAITLDPDFVASYYNRGNALNAIGDGAGAIADYSETIRLDPDFVYAYYSRGNALSDSGDLTGAIADYDEAIRLAPDYIHAYYRRGLARYLSDDFAGAIADYDEAIRLKPDYANAYNSRGAAREVSGDLEGALADYDEALRLDPDHEVARRNRENLLKRM